jgi:hypothetical protein
MKVISKDGKEKEKSEKQYAGLFHNEQILAVKK